MAHYNFKCTKCDNIDEKEISMNDIKVEQEKQTCSKCGAKSERVWQPWGGTTLCAGMYGIDGKSGWTT